MPTITVPVLIIGGGGCGLSSSLFLSDLGVEHLLVERHAGTSILPKAHYLNQRTMEIFRQHDLADAVYEVGAPLEHFGQIRWVTSLGGDGPLDGREIHRLDAFGGGALRSRYEADGPVLATNYPQLRLEPLLRAEAERRAPGKIRYSHEVTSWEQQDDGVLVHVLDRATGDELTVHARYVIVADGGKTVGPVSGVTMEGPTGMVDMVSTHFSADLSEYWDDNTLITWFSNPEGVSSWQAGALVQVGPTWGRNSEEWVIHFAFRPDDPERFNEEAIIPRLRELLRLPELEVEVHKVSHWILDRIVADKWRVGDMFLAGDAAHRQPPTTGLGLNTGIQDAHNLTWKLAQVLAGTATDALLDTYEHERKPVATEVADWALMAFNHDLIDAGIGLVAAAPVEANRAAFHALFSEGLLGEARRERARHAIDLQKFEFQAHDLELGYHYTSASVVPDGTDPAPRSATGDIYHPTSRPGHLLPHAWLDADGRRVSTHDLVGGDGAFALIAGSDAGPWIAAASTAAQEYGIRIEPVRLGVDALDADGRWAEIGEIGATGAILVRPDNHVAWRASGPAADAERVLVEAVGTVLCR